MRLDEIQPFGLMIIKRERVCVYTSEARADCSREANL